MAGEMSSSFRMGEKRASPGNSGQTGESRWRHEKID
jgi:hypothetical protein